MIASLVGLTLIGCISGALAVRNHAADLVREKGLAAVSTRLGRDVRAGTVEVGWGRATLVDVTVAGAAGSDAPEMSIDTVEIEFDLGDALGGKTTIHSVDVRGLTATVRRAADGTTNFDFVSESRERAAANQAAGDSPVTLPESIGLRGVDLTISDAGARASAKIVIEDGSVRRAQGGVELTLARARALGFAAHRRADELLSRNKLAALAGTIVVTRGGLEADVRGSFDDNPNATYHVVGKLAAPRSAELSVSGKQITLDRFGWLARKLAVSAPQQGVVSGTVTASVADGVVLFGADVTARGVSLSHSRLALEPVADIDGAVKLAGRYDRRAGTVHIGELRASRGGVDYIVKADVSLPNPAREGSPHASLRASFEVPTVGCQAALSSLPHGLVPKLAGFELEGQFAGRIDVAIDWSDIDATELTSDIGIDGCKVTAAPTAMSAQRLAGTFEHRAPIEGGYLEYTIGPENPEFVPISSVSKHLRRSLLTTEDSGFFRHKGFINSEFRTALVSNLKRGRFAYGASSITMQMVKNVLLSREKTVSRKLQELFLVWYLESELDKKRILEIYLNAIEFGPGLYGIGPAAKQYFNKHPRRLNPVEAAFFSSLLPAPRRRFEQLCRGRASFWTSRKMERIVDVMFERNRLTVDEYLRAVDTPLVFRGRRTADVCKQQRTASARGATRKSKTRGTL